MLEKKSSSKRGKKKNKLTHEQIEQKFHRSEVRGIFTKSGFIRVPGASDKEINFESVRGDFDDIFVYKNIVVLAEYTISSTANVSDHLKKKKILFDKVLLNQADFISYIKNKFPSFNDKLTRDYHKTQYKICIVYASKNKIHQNHKHLVDIVYLDYPILKYFSSVVDSIKKSAKNEILSFLCLKRSDIEDVQTSCVRSLQYKGSILPEAHSNFKDGFKVVSFYIDPRTLLERSYVLRKDGWRDGDGLYQRMISKGKVEAIRKHLLTKKRVFINNIVVTLPNNTKVIDEKGNTKDLSTIAKTEPVNISLPDEFNTIGIIDGQHRVFAYHEGGFSDEQIQELRDRQNLLVTGIIYPEHIKPNQTTKFEATLFLEINSNQTNAKSSLKQAIGLLLSPFAAPSIGKQVINKLNENGPLFDKFERFFYDTQKIKTTSIVSYALVPLVKMHGSDSLFSLWNDQNKHLLKESTDKDLLEKYIDFCVNEINKLMIAARRIIPSDKWTPDNRIKGRFLTTTNINGLLICLRKLIEFNKIGTSENYFNALQGLNDFSFSSYHSSQYGRMANDLFETFFKN